MSSSAVVLIQDMQFRVSEDQVVRVPRLDQEVGAKVEFDQVLLVSGDASEGGPRVGQPTVDGATVTAEVVEHGRGEKVIVFKMKRRKNYRRTKGHRQAYTDIRIKSIVG